MIEILPDYATARLQPRVLVIFEIKREIKRVRTKLKFGWIVTLGRREWSAAVVIPLHMAGYICGAD